MRSEDWMERIRRQRRNRSRNGGRWRAVVDQVRESGQRPSRFCRKHELDLARGYYWRRVFAIERIEKAPAERKAVVRHGKEVAGGLARQTKNNLVPSATTGHTWS